MANLRNELKSRHASLRRLYDDLQELVLCAADWDTEVRADGRLVLTTRSSTGFSPSISWSPGATGWACSIASAAISANPTSLSEDVVAADRGTAKCWFSTGAGTGAGRNHRQVVGRAGVRS